MADVALANDLVNHLGTAVLAIGALGTASYGIVDGMKLFSWVDLAGFERIFSGRLPWRHKANLDALKPALELAYGNDVMSVLQAQYRNGRAKGDLARTLRQGVRIGIGLMTPEQLSELAKGLGIPEAAQNEIRSAREAARKLQNEAERRALEIEADQEQRTPLPTLSDEYRAALARLETTIDARIDAALVLAENQYITQSKVYAMVVSMAVAFGVGKCLLDQKDAYWVLVGLAAVPLAPVAKDVSTAIQSAAKALRAR